MNGLFLTIWNHIKARAMPTVNGPKGSIFTITKEPDINDYKAGILSIYCSFVKWKVGILFMAMHQCHTWIKLKTNVFMLYDKWQVAWCMKLFSTEQLKCSENHEILHEAVSSPYFLKWTVIRMAKEIIFNDYINIWELTVGVLNSQIILIYFLGTQSQSLKSNFRFKFSKIWLRLIVYLSDRISKIFLQFPAFDIESSLCWSQCSPSSEVDVLIKP